MVLWRFVKPLPKVMGQVRILTETDQDELPLSSGCQRDKQTCIFRIRLGGLSASVLLLAVFAGSKNDVVSRAGLEPTTTGNLCTASVWSLCTAHSGNRIRTVVTGQDKVSHLLGHFGGSFFGRGFCLTW